MNNVIEMPETGISRSDCLALVQRWLEDDGNNLPGLALACGLLLGFYAHEVGETDNPLIFGFINDCTSWVEASTGSSCAQYMKGKGKNSL